MSKSIQTMETIKAGDCVVRVEDSHYLTVGKCYKTVEVGSWNVRLANDSGIIAGFDRKMFRPATPNETAQHKIREAMAVMDEYGVDYYLGFGNVRKLGLDGNLGVEVEDFLAKHYPLTNPKQDKIDELAKKQEELAKQQQALAEELKLLEEQV